ncbi:hypothetical protein HK099_001864, partial [Clydaea vesicula]
MFLNKSFKYFPHSNCIKTITRNLSQTTYLREINKATNKTENDKEQQNKKISLNSMKSLNKMLQVKHNSRIELDENDLEEVFKKGGGAGGQKVNKTNSK